jgi:hypothetical protein
MSSSLEMAPAPLVHLDLAELGVSIASELKQVTGIHEDNVDRSKAIRI